MVKQNDPAVFDKPGVWPRALRILENALRQDIDGHERRIQAVEQIQAADLTAWRGTERRESGVNFSDAQRKELKEAWDERAEVWGGRIFFRLILWNVGALATLAATIIAFYFNLKG